MATNLERYKADLTKLQRQAEEMSLDLQVQALAENRGLE
jgi:hypothetical protein